MEDVFEEVVGEIDVGYDFDEYHPKRKIYIEHENENVHLMSGRMPISEVNDILHAKFPVTEAHTIGGLIVSRLRHIPAEGDAIEEQGYLLKVLESDARSVVKVQVERL
jgi:putative hemolysin